MTEKLINQRTPADPPSQARVMLHPPAQHDQQAARWLMLIGPVIGFMLAACLAISFALALAGGAGEAALGTGHAGGPIRTAVFVL